MVELILLVTTAIEVGCLYATYVGGFLWSNFHLLFPRQLSISLFLHILLTPLHSFSDHANFQTTFSQFNCNLAIDQIQYKLAKAIWYYYYCELLPDTYLILLLYWTMGCAPSTTMSTSPLGSPTLKRRRSTATVASLDALTDQQVATSIKTRYGHPSQFKEDGYDIGLRVRV